MASALISQIDRIVLIVGGILLVAMMIHVSVDIIAKLAFNAPIALTGALVTEYYMVAVAFLALAAGEYRQAHIAVDIVVLQMPPRVRGIVELLGMILSALIFSVLAVQAWQQAVAKFASSAFIMEQATRVTVWPAFFFLPIGFGLMAALLLVKIVCRLARRPEPSPPETPSTDPALVEPS